MSSETTSTPSPAPSSPHAEGPLRPDLTLTAASAPGRSTTATPLITLEALPGLVRREMDGKAASGRTEGGLHSSLVRVECEDLRTQLNAVLRLQSELRAEGVEYLSHSASFALEPKTQGKGAIPAICQFLDRVDESEAEVVLVQITGGGGAEEPRGTGPHPVRPPVLPADAVEAFGYFQYEFEQRYARAGRHFLLWLSPAVAIGIAQQVPELEARFTQRLRLAKQSTLTGRGTRPSQTPAAESTRQAETARRVASFLYRNGFNLALAQQDCAQQIMVDLIAAGVKTLLDAGLVSDARNFCNSCLTALSLRESARAHKRDLPLDGDLHDANDQAPFRERTEQALAPEHWLDFTPVELDTSDPASPAPEADQKTTIEQANVLTVRAHRAQMEREYDAAEKLLVQAFCLCASHLGWGHPQTILGLRDLGLLSEYRAEDTYRPELETL